MAVDKKDKSRARYGDFSIAFANSAVDEDRYVHHTLDAGQRPTYHSHAYTEIVLVSKGESNIFSLSDGISVKAPFIAIYPAGVPHIQLNTVPEGYVRCLLSCYGDCLEKRGLGYLMDDKKVFAFNVDEYSAKVFEALFLLLLTMRNEPEEETEPVKDRLFKLLGKMTSGTVRIHEQGRVINDKQYFGELLRYIAEHYNEKLSLTMLASKFYVSRTKLSRDFSAIMNMSVGEYIMKIRIRNALDKLNAGTSIADTAKQCGFVSTSYFVQMFKKHIKRTPLHYTKHDSKEYYNSFNISDAIINQEAIKMKYNNQTEENK